MCGDRVKMEELKRCLLFYGIFWPTLNEQAKLNGE
jgi:hypothetical protein